MTTLPLKTPFLGRLFQTRQAPDPQPTTPDLPPNEAEMAHRVWLCDMMSRSGDAMGSDMNVMHICSHYGGVF